MSLETINQLQSANETLRLEAENLRRRLEEVEVALRGERKRTEDILQQASGQQDEFLSVLAHDLRNPLVPMLNAVEIMRLPDTSASQRQRAIDIIDGQVCELRRLLDDLLDVSRIMRRKIDLRLQPIELAKVVAHVVEACRPLIDRKKQQFTVALPAEPVWLNVDPARMGQVIAHLLNNSAKFTDEEGRIHLSAATTGEEVIVRVEDDGIGIAPEFLPRVFELFAKADDPQARFPRGLGIGLTVVRKLLELHGGSVQGLSEGTGRGSAFLFRLPRLSDSERRQEQPREPLSSVLTQPSRRILVVTGNKDFAEEWSMLLRVAGHVVQTAHNVADALEAAQAFHPQVISLDIGFPDFDGCEVAQRMRKQPGMENLCVVAIAESDHKEGERRAREAGCDAFLTKPVMIRDFLNLIARS